MIGNNKKSGFVLIEMLAAMLAFSILATLISALFAQAIKFERKAAIAASLQDSITYIIETMSKEFRIGCFDCLPGVPVQETDADCLSQSTGQPLINLVFERAVAEPTGDNIFLEKGVVYSYSSEFGIISRAEFLPSEPIPSTGIALNDQTDTNITNFRFCVSGSIYDDNKPTKITVSFNISNRVGSPLSIPVQTTVTSRNTYSEMTNE